MAGRGGPAWRVPDWLKAASRAASAANKDETIKRGKDETIKRGKDETIKRGTDDVDEGDQYSLDHDDGTEREWGSNAMLKHDDGTERKRGSNAMFKVFGTAAIGTAIVFAFITWRKTWRKT